jgi:hypothetical protein
MNGRILDAYTGRFLSADPLLSEPLLTQNYNRYSYVNNRPFAFTDPSGFEAMMEVVVTGSRAGSKPAWCEGTCRFKRRAPTPSRSYGSRGGGSSAQTTPTPQDDAEEEEELQEVVVTGTKPREQAVNEASFGPALAFIRLGAYGLRALRALRAKNAANLAAKANKLNHIFGKAGHNLEPLVKQLGSREAVFNKVQSATQASVKSLGLKGVFQTTVKVGGQNVVVRGNVIGGVARIGTFFVR